MKPVVRPGRVAPFASLALMLLAAAPSLAGQAPEAPQQERPLAEAAVISGVTAYDPAQLLQFAMAHARAGDGLASAERIAAAIELIYREDGFALADVTLSYSEDGNPVFQVAEGRLQDVAITGLRPGTAARVQAYTAGLISRVPLRQSDLERALMLSSDLAGVAIGSLVSPAAGGGGAILSITGTERRAAGAAGFEIVPIRPGSALRGFVVQEAYGVATGGDLLRLMGQATLDRGNDWSASGFANYRTPIGASGAYVEVMGGNTAARREFASISQDSRLIGWNAALVVGYPVQRSLTHFTYVLAEYEYVDATSRFLGQKLESSAHAIRIRALTGIDPANGSQFRMAFTASGGRRPETVAGQAPDGAETFAHLRSEIGWTVPLDSNKPSSLRLEFRGQWASARLPEVERISMGHAPFLRGYAPAELIGDRGVGATVEFSHGIEGGGVLRQAIPFVFAAAGRTEILDARPTEVPSTTAVSVGIGSNFHLRGRLNVAGWVALPLRDGPQSRSGSPAVYASMTVGW
jgi:hemolysin activation/secretion protein